MTHAILLALTAQDSDQSTALLEIGGEPVVARLTAQLRRLGLDDIVVLTRPEWQSQLEQTTEARILVAEGLEQVLERLGATALDGETDVLITHADVVTHTSALRALLEDPRVGSGALTSRDQVAAPTFRLRSSRDRIVGAESPFHAIGGANRCFLDVLVLEGRHRTELARVTTRLRELVTDGLPTGWEEVRSRREASPGASGGHEIEPDPVAMVLVGLVRRDVHVADVPVRDYVWSRPRSPDEASRASTLLSDVDEDRIRLDAAVKPEDGFFTTFFVSPYSKYVARWSARAGLTPNQVTLASLLVAVGAAAAFGVGTPSALVLGAVLLQVSFVLDCVDGQLARYTFSFSELGGWLDGVLDRVKEYVVYGGLAAGAGSEFAWVLACVALTVQVVRHQLDFGYAAQHEGTIATRVDLPIERPDEPEPTALEGGAIADSGAAASVVRAADWAGQGAVLRWLKRIVPLPIGERFALISLTAVLGGPVLAFWALIVWGSAALAYITAGRVARALA